jgi:hypothetical protein
MCPNFGNVEFLLCDPRALFNGCKSWVINILSHYEYRVKTITQILSLNYIDLKQLPTLNLTP